MFRSGVAAAARSLALELAPDVLVNVVVTGQFDTPALGRFEAAKAAHEGKPADEVRAEHIAGDPARPARHAPTSSPTSWRSSARRGRRSSPAPTIRVDGGAIRGF